MNERSNGSTHTLYVAVFLHDPGRPPPIAIEFEEFGDDGAADAGAVERELAMHEAPARKVRKAPAKRKRPESNAVVASIPSVGEA